MLNLNFNHWRHIVVTHGCPPYGSLLVRLPVLLSLARMSLPPVSHQHKAVLQALVLQQVLAFVERASTAWLVAHVGLLDRVAWTVVGVLAGQLLIVEPLSPSDHYLRHCPTSLQQHKTHQLSNVRPELYTSHSVV